MSRPQNPLNFFRTYSYHHILVACDGTNTATQLAKVNELTAFDHENAEARFCPQRVPNGIGKYVVLSNGMSDAQFTVKMAKWSSVLIPNSESGEGTTHFRTMAVDGEMVIQEPLGVSFLNLLNDITKSLGTDPNGVAFLLKTIFVGHRDDGRTETISTIRPLIFIAYDISALFDVTGAEYTFAFVGVVNGAARLPHISAVGDGFGYKVKENSTLEQAMQGLEVELNLYYSDQKKELIKQSKKTNQTFQYDDEFIDVTYKILLHQDYKPLAAGTTPPPSVNDKGNNDPCIQVKGDSISVESLIDTIMQSSQAVLDEDQNDNEPRHMFKITSALKTGPEEYVVEYEIQRFASAVVPVENFLSFEPPVVDGQSQGIVFDYIFTGKNIDIKTFDIKMQMGMAFFQTLAASSSLPTDAASVLNHYNPQTMVNGTGNLQGSGDQQERGGCELDVRTEGKKRRKPLFLGMSVKDSSIRNKRLPGSSVSYNTLLLRHAAYENIEARMVIHGNPQLLEETTQLPDDLNPDAESTMQTIQTDASSQASPEERSRGIMSAIHRVPGYIKVNVFMPTDFSIKDPNNVFNADYAQNFWYNGWYFLYAINHVFSEGEFTQELEMFSIPTDASQKELTNVKPEEDSSETPDLSGEQEKRTVGQVKEQGQGT